MHCSPQPRSRGEVEGYSSKFLLTTSAPNRALSCSEKLCLRDGLNAAPVASDALTGASMATEGWMLHRITDARWRVSPLKISIHYENTKNVKAYALRI